MELISAVFCGRLDPSVMASAPVLVTSSCSTDETVLADSDAEVETATSVCTSAAINITDSAEDGCETKTAILKTEPPVKDRKAESFVHVIESIEHDSRGKTDARTTEHGSQGFLPPKQDTFKPDSPHQSSIMSDRVDITLSRDSDEGIMTRKDKGHLSDSENLEKWSSCKLQTFQEDECSIRDSFDNLFHLRSIHIKSLTMGMKTWLKP